MLHSLVIIFLLVGVSHGFLGPIDQLVGNIGDKFQSITNQIGQTASNLWNGVTGNIANNTGTVYNQLVDTNNEVQFAFNFLWDSVFSPTYDMMIEGKLMLI